jgi:hypothetical protein
MARPAATLDQTVAIEHGVDGAAGGNPDLAGQPPHQKFANLARAPVRLLALEADDQGLDLRGQLVGWLAYRTGRRERSVRAASPCSL